MFIPLMMLVIESSEVVALRMWKFASWDKDSLREAELMVREKVDAAFEARANFITGASNDQILHQYRHHVASNVRRLSARNRP